MGLIRKSFRKSRAMKKAEAIMCEEYSSFAGIMKQHDRKNEAFKELYAAMYDMPQFKGIIETTTPDEILRIADSISLIYDRQGTDFLPVALVSFPRPLSYLLQHKQIVIEKGQTDWEDIITQAISLL